jgi:hypothetical protein
MYFNNILYYTNKHISVGKRREEKTLMVMHITASLYYLCSFIFHRLLTTLRKHHTQSPQFFAHLTLSVSPTCLLAQHNRPF